jgi:multiple sugar transport system substrate-binding protein
MKKNKKSAIPLIYCLSVVFFLAVFAGLSACAQAPDDTPEPLLPQTLTPEKTTAPEPTSTARPSPTPITRPVIDLQAEDLEGMVLRFMHPWTGQTAEVLADIATQFSLTNPWNIWVDVEGHGSESALLEALSQDIDAGDAPDLIAIHPYLLGALDKVYTTVPITDYAYDPNWGLDEAALEDIPEVFLGQFTQNNQLVAMPIAPQATLLFYQQTWAESLEFSSPPDNAADFQRLSCNAAFANRDDGNPDHAGTGGWIVNFHPNVLSAWFLAFGGDLPQSGTPTFNTEAGRDALGFLKTAYDQGCFWTGRQSEPYFYFANRYAIAFAGTLGEIPVQAGWMTAGESDDQWSVIGFPGPEGQILVVDGPGLMIGADSPEIQLASWLFARHLLTPEVQAKLVQTLFTLPVRRSALPLLDAFSEEYAQWGAGVALMDNAVALPISEEWGLSQWLLQDAGFRLLQSEELSPEEVLEELDQMIIDLEGTTP